MISLSRALSSLIAVLFLSLSIIACGGGSSSAPTPPDLTPNSFSFAEITDVELSTVIESDPVTISGIDESVSVSITGGEFSINGGAFMSGSGSIDNGQTIAVRITSSDNYATSVNTTVTVGGVSGTFTVTTVEDTTPDAFSFNAQQEIAPSTLVESNSVTISGLGTATAISVSNGEYSIDGGDFTSDAGTIESGQAVVVRQTSSADFETTTTTILTIGDVDGSFDVTTEGSLNFEGFTGAALNSRLQTHNVQINDIGDQTPISIENGEYQLDRGAWTDQDGFIDNGQEVRVRARAGEDYNVTTTARLNVGESWGYFSIVTKEHGDFISVWKTDNEGASDDNQIMLPLESNGTYNFTVDWGDGTSETITQWDQAEVTHTYAQAGTYTVTISGEIEGFAFRELPVDQVKLLEIKSWGSLKLGNLGENFLGASNLVFTGNDALDLSGTTIIDYMFAFSDNFNGDISNWDVSSVIDMQYMFYRATAFNSDISRWDVSSVTNMTSLFRNASTFGRDISSWDVSSVTDMTDMLNNSGLSNEYYSASLIAWSQLPNLQNDVTLGATDIYFNSSASSARDSLINTKSWTINDAGPEPVN